MSEFKRGDRVQILIHKDWCIGLYLGKQSGAHFVHLDSDTPSDNPWAVKSYLVRKPLVKVKRMMQAWQYPAIGCDPMIVTEAGAMCHYHGAKKIGEPFEMEFEVPQ